MENKLHPNQEIRIILDKLAAGQTPQEIAQGHNMLEYMQERAEFILANREFFEENISKIEKFISQYDIDTPIF